MEEENDVQEFNCSTCSDEGIVEIIGDGDNFECDVIGHKQCPDCNED